MSSRGEVLAAVVVRQAFTTSPTRHVQMQDKRYKWDGADPRVEGEKEEEEEGESKRSQATGILSQAGSRWEGFGAASE